MTTYAINPYSAKYNQLLAVPSMGDLDAYTRAVNAVPMLTPEQEYEFAMSYRADPNNLQPAHALVVSHLRVVVSIARNYSGYGLPQGDLIQEGSIGLMKAVKRFDPDRGVRLVSFAMHWIKAEIHEYILKNWRQVKLATTKAQRKLFFNLRSMKSDYEGVDTLSGTQATEIAQRLGVKQEEVIEMETRLSGRDMALEGSPDDSDDAFAPIDYLADSRYEPTRVLENKAIARLENEGLQEALATLDVRSRRLVEARWLNDGEGATLHDLAAEFAVSAERIRQIEVKALQKMRGALTPD